MLDLVYLLVPSSVPSERILESSHCYATLDVPGLEGKASIFVLQPLRQREGCDWYHEDNVVLKATSRTLICNVSGALDKLAVSAAVDACRMRNKPPALREV